MPHALAIRVGRLGQSASVNECYKAHLTGVNPVELVNIMATDAKSSRFFAELNRVTISL